MNFKSLKHLDLNLKNWGADNSYEIKSSSVAILANFIERMKGLETLNLNLMQ